MKIHRFFHFVLPVSDIRSASACEASLCRSNHATMPARVSTSCFDIGVQLAPGTPTPIIKHLKATLTSSGFDVEEHNESMLVATLRTNCLEAHAEVLGMEKPLQANAPRAWSEQVHPFREFSVKERSNFVIPGVPANCLFTPAERAAVILEFCDSRLLCGATFSAALMAAGREDAVTPKPCWLVGFATEWSGQPLLTALSSLGYVLAVAPLHTAERRQSSGLPLTASALPSWLARAIRYGELVSIERIRSYWGEGVAFYFAWQQFYVRALLVPCVCGVAVRMLRPASISVDDDPNVPMFALLAVSWAIVFCTLWRGRSHEYAFAWGTHSHRTERLLRPEFVGVPTTDPISGEAMLHDPLHRRACRIFLSGLVTLASLCVPVCAMVASLNLQGYIVEATGPWLGLPVYVPSLARYAAPGALFDPKASTESALAAALPFVPVGLHALVIFVLNTTFRHVAEYLTDLENHRTYAAHDASLLLKRFAFEACDCYLVLFYIAFELQDVPKLRTELIALFTADTIRRVLLETLVPLLLNWRHVRDTTNPAAQMALEPYEDFDDYLEMVLQFGYVTLFASACPLAAAACVVCNSIELIADSIKLTVLCRRPRPARANSIGGWSTCLYLIMLASIYTNIAIMGISSDQMAALFPSLFTVPPKVQVHGLLTRALQGVGLRRSGSHGLSGESEMRKGMGRYVILLMVAMEHALLLLLLLCEVTLTRAPAWVRLAKARRAFEATGHATDSATVSGSGGGAPAGASARKRSMGAAERAPPPPPPPVREPAAWPSVRPPPPPPVTHIAAPEAAQRPRAKLGDTDSSQNATGDPPPGRG